MTRFCSACAGDPDSGVTFLAALNTINGGDGIDFFDASVGQIMGVVTPATPSWNP